MIINDKALVKMMNFAKKNGGYRIATTKGEPAWIYLAGHNWYVGVQWDKLSAKVKGIMTEHLGEYIQPGDAWHILKKGFQEEYYEDVTEPIFDLNTSAKAVMKNESLRVRPTPIMWREDMLYRREDGKLLLLDPALMDMAVQFTWYPIQVNDWLFWDAGTEQLYIRPEEPYTSDVEFIKKIAALDWAPKEE